MAENIERSAEGRRTEVWRGRGMTIFKASCGVSHPSVRVWTPKDDAGRAWTRRTSRRLCPTIHAHPVCSNSVARRSCHSIPKLSAPAAGAGAVGART